MQYVSAEYVPSPMEGQPPMIKAMGDDGVEYWIPSADTDVPPWPDFLETATGKAFLAKEPPPTYPNQTVPDVQQDAPAEDDDGPKPAA